MDARRRTIALSQDGPLGNGGYGQTGIPIPGSTMKKPALRAPAARMSMAPAARVVSGGSSSLAPGLGSSQDGGAGTRRSTMAPPPGARGGMGGLGMGVTPQSNRMMGGGGSVRRQSHFPSAGRPSVLPGSQKPQDPRPIRSAGFQQSCRESIESFCRMHRCPVAMTEKTLVSPTAKDFFTLFKWLYNEFIDPAYAWPAKNLVDDITAVLRDLRYPALDSISKTSFSAPGDTRSWPLLLALLSWLVDLAKAQAMWQDRTVINDPLLIPASEWPANHDLLDDRLLWDYVSTMYVQWFQGAGEDFPEAEQELREAYDRIQQATLQDADELETLVQRRTAELQTLQAQEPPLKQLEDEYIRLKSDQSKFIAFIELHKQKADKIRQGISKAKSIVADNELILEAGRAELANIEAAVAAQNLSPDEVQRMNADRDNLQRQIEDLRVKIGEASQHSYDQEMAVTKLMDRFDSYVSDYTQLAHSIGTIQPLADVPGALGPGDVDYSIDIETTMEDIAAVQAQGRRLRHEIWPALQAYSEGFRREMAEVENQHIQVDDEHDRLAQRVERQKEEAANLEMKLGVVHEQAEEARSRFQAESSSSNQAIQKLENEVAQIQMSTRMGVQDVRSAIETTQIEFKELRHKTAALQDSLSREILSHVDVIVKAKEHASAQFQSVRAFAEATQ